MCRPEPVPIHRLRWPLLVTCVLAGMLLATLRFRAQFPWSYADWTFWTVFRDLARMPLVGYGGVGCVLWVPLLGAAIAGLRAVHKGSAAVAGLGGPAIAAATGYLWMCLGDVVASLGV